jgi:Zn-dependent protease/uncharacterized Zn finger protein (UPF0148 family)
MDGLEVKNACPDCGAVLPPGALSCPHCHSLTHARQLQDLARKAQAASNAGNLALARTYWAQVAELLPPETVQHRSIQARLADLDQQIRMQPSSGTSAIKKGAAGLGPIAVLLWKFKALLLGLTKIGTLLSMFASFGVYWSWYGWPLALGLVLSIYIHEMGHVFALRRFGIPAGAPMFIPGFGAIIQLRGVALPPVQDARIGLAGPIYGLGTALFCLVVYYVTGMKIWGVIASLGAIINLFNLIPIWQLDGARGFHSLTRMHRAMLLVLTVALWLVASVKILFLVALGMAYRLFKKDAPQEPDNTGFIQFALLLVALTATAALAH